MRRALLIVLPLVLSACQSVAADGRARVDMNDPATHAAVTAALSEAVGRGHIELGPTDGYIVTVLPPKPGPYEGNSPAMPVRFDIEKRGDACVAVRHDTGQVVSLPGVTCTAG